MLSLGFILTPYLNPLALPIVLAPGFIVALGFTSMGIAIASTMRSPEGFQLVVGLLTLPTTLLSGAMFPLSNASYWMQIAALALPLTYAVDLIRYYLVGISFLNSVYWWLTPEVELLLLVVTSVILMVLAIEMFKRTTIE